MPRTIGQTMRTGKPRGLLQLDGPPVAPARLATLTRLADLLAAAMAGYEAAGGTKP